MERLWVRGAADLDLVGRETLVAIGNFDGVHRGHQALLREALAEARELVPMVLTFRPHPAAALGRTPPAVLTSLDRKAELLIHHFPFLRVLAHPFDEAFARKSPEEFARFLRDELGARRVVVGQNFRFGRGRQGDLAALRELGALHGFEVLAIPLQSDERGPWSSTRVRAALAGGDLLDARHVLGRPHELDGVVVQGQQRARHLGFPTANLASVEQAAPAFGVYAVRVDRLADGQVEPLGGGVANIGVRPTLAAGFSIEAHIFGLDADLYGQKLRLRLMTRLREERTFAGLDALRAQIEQDVDAARAALRAEEQKP